MSTLAASSSSSSSTSPSPASESTRYIVTSEDKDDSKFQIFLGGSCNPTTWRQNVAIPFLEMNGISYYNPQVDNWTPEAVDSERYAKQNAQILLFVIDKQTRSTVSLVESAFMAGDNKNLVLVIYPFDYNILSLRDKSKQTSICVESRSRQTETTSGSPNNSGIQSSSFVKSSTSLSTSTLKSSSPRTPNELDSESSATRASSTKIYSKSAKINREMYQDNCEIDQRTSELIHAEATQAGGSIKMNGEVIGLAELTELKRARHILQSLVAFKKIPMFPDILQALNHISRSMVDDNETQKNPEDRKKIEPLNISDQQQRTTYNNPKPTEDISLKDIYLSHGGDEEADLESIIIPILKEKGLTYNYVPLDNIRSNRPELKKSVIASQLALDPQVTNRCPDLLDLCEDTKLAIEKEISAIRDSRVLLFVITNKCRGLSVMVLASHFMALFRNNVVLCVQYLEEPCFIGGECLTKDAIADYNRGRVYLCDYAIKAQVPVFSTIREAIECCSRKCHVNKKC